MLVELDADRAAARTTSRAAVRSALCRVLQQQATNLTMHGVGYHAAAHDIQTTNDRRLHVLAAETSRARGL